MAFCAEQLTENKFICWTSIGHVLSHTSTWEPLIVIILGGDSVWFNRKCNPFDFHDFCRNLVDLNWPVSSEKATPCLLLAFPQYKERLNTWSQQSSFNYPLVPIYHLALTVCCESLLQQLTDKKVKCCQRWNRFFSKDPMRVSAVQNKATEVRSTWIRCRLCLCIAWMSGSEQVAVNSLFSRWIELNIRLLFNISSPPGWFVREKYEEEDNLNFLPRC